MESPQPWLSVTFSPSFRFHCLQFRRGASSAIYRLLTTFSLWVKATVNWGSCSTGISRWVWLLTSHRLWWYFSGLIRMSLNFPCSRKKTFGHPEGCDQTPRAELSSVYQATLDHRLPGEPTPGIAPAWSARNKRTPLTQMHLRRAGCSLQSKRRSRLCHQGSWESFSHSLELPFGGQTPAPCVSQLPGTQRRPVQRAPRKPLQIEN